MKRIAIIGCCGAGKSTLARTMGQKLGLPVIHLDYHYWQSGWIPTPKPDWIRLQQRLVQNSDWIIDGNYRSTLDLRIEAADTIIFLVDFQRSLCLWRVIRRYLSNIGRVRSDMASGCPERLTLEFLWYVWQFRQQHRPKILSLLEIAQKSKQVIILYNPQQVIDFLEQMVAIA